MLLDILAIIAYMPLVLVRGDARMAGGGWRGRTMP